jgi:hypothetical protein
MSTRSRQRQSAHKKKHGGALTGLRTGFKRATGVAGGLPAKKRKSPVGTIVTVLLVLAAAALLFYRNR